MTSFAVQLAAALKTAGVSRAELSRRVRCSRATVSDWCAGRQRPTRERLTRINEALGTNIGLTHKITAEDVAQMMGLHVDTLRRSMRMGMLTDIGVAIPSRNGERYCFRFFPEAIRQKLGII